MALLYADARAWRAARRKRITVFGMSGLGKTRLAAILRAEGDWFHYSIDYRIGTAYMGEHIADNLKRQAMAVPFLADLLRSDSIYIGSNLTFENLAPLSSFLGKPGDPAKGGIPLAEYRRRQALHARAEVNALLDTPHFIDRAGDLYGYPHFVCDTGGSICEVVDPEDPADPVLTTLSRATLPVWIEETAEHTQALCARFDAAPKPMYYRPDFLEATWTAFLNEDPDTTAGPDVEDIGARASARHTPAPAGPGDPDVAAGSRFSGGSAPQGGGDASDNARAPAAGGRAAGAQRSAENVTPTAVETGRGAAGALGRTGDAELPDRAARVDPDAFVRYAYARALAHRQPLYAAMARNWGIRVTAEAVAQVRDAADAVDMIAAALP